MAVERQRLTYDDYVAFPDDGLRRELIGGELVVTPSANTRHQRIQARLLHALFEEVQRTGVGEVFTDLDVRIDRDEVVRPDLILVTDPDRLNALHALGAPRLIVEIVSDPRTDYRIKRDLYRDRGVPEYWIIDKDRDRVEVYRSEDAYATPRVLLPGDVLTTPLLPGLDLSVADVLRR